VLKHASSNVACALDTPSHAMLYVAGLKDSDDGAVLALYGMCHLKTARQLMSGRYDVVGRIAKQIGKIPLWVDAVLNIFRRARPSLPLNIIGVL